MLKVRFEQEKIGVSRLNDRNSQYHDWRGGGSIEGEGGYQVQELVIEPVTA